MTATQLVKTPDIEEKSGAGTASEPERTIPKRGREEFTGTNEPKQKENKNSPDNLGGASETTEPHSLPAMPPPAAKDKTQESEAKKKEESSVTKDESKVSPAVLVCYI